MAYDENTVVVVGNELLCGVLDKSQFGASEFGIVHVRGVSVLYQG